MGWTGTHRAPGLTNREYFEGELFGYPDNPHEILDVSTVRGAVYGAVRDRRTGRVWALVVAIRWRRGYHNLVYKEMSEASGPCYFDCPARILDVLSPTDDRLALAWREQCREELAKPRPRAGDIVRFRTPIRFQDGSSLATFTFRKGSSFQHRGTLYRITNWRDHGLDVLGAEAQAV